jgi:hypothetical protein
MPDKAHLSPIGSRPDVRAPAPSERDARDHAPSPDTEESPDFADEHTDTTVGDGISDHEDSDDIETESPRGLGGMDIPPDPLREV